MANDVKIRFLVTENVTESTNKMNSSLKKNETQATKTSGSIKSLNAQWIAAAAVAAGLYASVKSLTDAYREQEKAEKKLSAALRVTGQYTDDTFRSMKSFATEMQELTIYGDEAVMQLEQMALNMGLTAEKAQEATQGALALSSAFGIDAKSAIKGVTTALQGDFNLLSRYIPELRTTTDQTEKLAILNKTLSQSFDVARAEADTFSGILDQNKNLLGDVKEKLGEVVAIAAEEPLKDLNTSLRDMNTVLSTLVGGFRNLKDRFDDIKKSSPAVSAGLNTIFAALAPGAFALKMSSDGMNNVADSIRDATTRAEQAKAITDLFDNISAVTEKMRGLGDNANTFASRILKSKSELQSMVDSGGISATDALSTLEELNAQLTEYYDKITGKTGIKPPSPLPDAEEIDSSLERLRNANDEVEAMINQSYDNWLQRQNDISDKAIEQYITGAQVFTNAFEGAFNQFITGSENLGKALEKAIVSALAQIAAKMAVSGIFKLLAMIPGVGTVFGTIGSIVSGSVPVPSGLSATSLPTPTAIPTSQGGVMIQNYIASPFASSTEEDGKELARSVEKIQTRNERFALS